MESGSGGSSEEKVKELEKQLNRREQEVEFFKLKVMSVLKKIFSLIFIY